jgi:hypothetical protein
MQRILLYQGIIKEEGLHMGTIIPFHSREKHHLPDDPAQSVDINTLLSHVEKSATDIATTLQACVQATACLQHYEVAPVQCARAAAYLHNLLQQVNALYRLIEQQKQTVANSYPVFIQSHHCATLLEQTIHAIQDVREQKGKLCTYLSAWRETRQQTAIYPTQVTELLANVSEYRKELVKHCLS